MPHLIVIGHDYHLQKSPFMRRFCMLLLFSVLLGCGVTAQQPVNNSQQAVAKANWLRQQLHWSVPNGMPRITQPGGDPNWPRTWQLQYRDGLFIIDSTNGAFFVASHTPPNVDAAQQININIQQARKLAVKYAQLVGIPLNNAAFDKCMLVSDYNRHRIWRLFYTEKYKGYPYYDNNIIMCEIEPADGSLQGITWGHRIKPPAQVKVLVTKDTALAKAHAQFVKLRMTTQIGKLHSAKLAIVTPNEVWKQAALPSKPTPRRPSGWRTSSPEPPSRLAWVLQFDDAHGFRGSSDVIFVDAANGAIIGGGGFSVHGRGTVIH